MAVREAGVVPNPAVGRLDIQPVDFGSRLRYYGAAASRSPQPFSHHKQHYTRKATGYLTSLCSRIDILLLLQIYLCSFVY